MKNMGLVYLSTSTYYHKDRLKTNLSSFDLFQTISIAKAGITTTLNSRCSVLAAANSVFGRWDDSKAEENIDFMPTILSRYAQVYLRTIVARNFSKGKPNLRKN